MTTPAFRRPTEEPQRSEIVVSNSRFITTVGRASSTEAARTFIAEIRAEMPDASHHVYAFRIGYGNTVVDGMSDDGEPSGTSGPPTLAVLRGTEIGDAVLVTTRYFGGTKLGKGGLVRAYTEAAQTALQNIRLELKAPKVVLGIELPYSYYQSLKRLLAQYEAHTDDENFATEVTIIATILQSQEDEFRADLANLTAGKADAVVLETSEET